jgi:hypothetical protein
MQDYRETKLTQITEPRTRTRKVDTIASLAEHYGIKDVGARQAESGSQSVEQEYQSYINGDLLEEGSDPLKFWEVCSHCPQQPIRTHADKSLPDERKDVPNGFPHSNGLPPNPSISCSM